MVGERREGDNRKGWWDYVGKKRELCNRCEKEVKNARKEGRRKEKGVKAKREADMVRRE